MQPTRGSWKQVALLAFAATLIFSVAAAAQNLTTGYVPGVQLSPSQFAQVAVSNISAASVRTTITVLNADGSTFMTKTTTVAANKTFVFRFQNGSTTAVYSAVVTSSVASSIVCDLQVLGSNNEVIAILQPQPNPANLVQNTPSHRLVPGQSAIATVTNITTTTSQFSLTVLDVNGNIVLTEQSVSINPGQTLSYSYSNTGTVNNSYRAVVSASTASSVISNVLLFDKTTGKINAILLPQPNPA